MGNHEYLQQSYSGLYGCHNIPEYLENDNIKHYIIDKIVHNKVLA